MHTPSLSRTSGITTTPADLTNSEQSPHEFPTSTPTEAEPANDNVLVDGPADTPDVAPADEPPSENVAPLANDNPAPPETLTGSEE